MLDEEATVTGITQLGIEVKERLENKRSLCQGWMGKRQVNGAQDEIADEEQVEVEGPRSLVDLSSTTQGVFNLEAEMQEIVRFQGGAKEGDGVQKIRLVGDGSNGGALIERGDALDKDPRTAKRSETLSQDRLATSKVRSETEINRALHGMLAPVISHTLQRNIGFALF